MTSRTYVRCRCCGRHKSEGADLSKRGYCQVCGPKIREEQWDSLHYHRGPEFQKWRRATAASVGAILVDDLIPGE